MLQNLTSTAADQNCKNKFIEDRVNVDPVINVTVVNCESENLIKNLSPSIEFE